MSECVISARYRLRVKQRLAIVAFAREHGIKPASRHFGFTRRTVRTWLRRWKANGEAGLVPKYPRQWKRRLPDTTIDTIRVARVDHQWGAPRTRVSLERVHSRAPSSESSATSECLSWWQRHAGALDRSCSRTSTAATRERRYNNERFSLALAGPTPAEKLASSILTSSSSRDVTSLALPA